MPGESYRKLCCACVSSFFLHSHNKVRGLHTGITVSVCSSVHVSGFFVFSFLHFDFILLFLDFLSFSLLFLFRDCIICELWYRSHSCYRTHFRCTLCRVRVTVSDSGWLGSKHRLTRPLQSLLLCCDAFGVLIHTLVCWFCRNHC